MKNKKEETRSGTGKERGERGRGLRKRKFLGCEWSSRYGAKSGAANIYEKKLSAR